MLIVTASISVSLTIYRAGIVYKGGRFRACPQSPHKSSAVSSCPEGLQRRSSEVRWQPSTISGRAAEVQIDILTSLDSVSTKGTMAARRAIAGRALRVLPSQSAATRPASIIPRMASTNANKTAVRRLHVTASHLRPATAAATTSAASTATDYPNSHKRRCRPDRE